MRRLGLDIGTNSIGWCLIEDDARIVDLGVRIFSDGRDPKSGASLAVDRRAARAMRRRRDRYLGRRNAFLIALKRHGLMPADATDAKLLADHDPYELRARALTERLDPFEIGRALFHLNQRRGFKSNRKAERRTKDAEDGKIAWAAKALDQEIAGGGYDTLGQFLHARLKAGEHARVRMNSASQSYDFYPDRRHVKYEFQRIWEEQAKHHPDLMSQSLLAWDELDRELCNRESAHPFSEARDALYRVLLFQRSLKEQQVGRCTFLPEDRLAKAHPLFQERRLYEEVNQLEITTPGARARKLTFDERDHIVRILREKQEVLFTSLATKLKLQPGQSFNKASANRTKLAGNEVYAKMADKSRFGNAWPHFSAERQWEIIRQLLDEENPETLHVFLAQECGLDEDQARTTARTSLPEGYGRIGETASRLILEQLKTGHENGAPLTYDQAVERCGWHHSKSETKKVSKLTYYGELLSREIPPGTQDPADPPEVRWGKITNPTVHIGLRQLEKLVNQIIAVHGRPDQIVVELARELKLNDKQKDEHNRRIRQDTAAAQLRSDKLQQMGVPDTGANRALLRLWEELNPANPLDRRCPYCAEMIGAEQLFSGIADIDHIIPYSRSLDDSASNKVVAHRSCNRAKGNRTPHEKWGDDPERWARITDQVARLHKSKQWRFGPDAMARVEKDGGFLARQLTDTQYLSRLARTYLSSLYSTKEEGSVYVIPGRMTSMLRRLWGLNSLLPDHNIVENPHSDAPKNRLDHRHHAIDAAVVAVTTRSLLNEIARTAAQAEDRDLDRLFDNLPQPWPGFREQLGEKLARVTVSHKADHGRKGVPAKNKDSTAGRLHNDTAYGLTGAVAADGKTPIVVHRVQLLSLKPEDIQSETRIPDRALRDALYDAVKDTSGKTFEAALSTFAKTHPQFAGIRRVRVREPLNVIQIRDRNGRAYKAYKGDANARYDVWRLPNGKWVHDIVPMFDAHQREGTDRRPHPAAKKVLSLRQNDMLAVERNGGPPELVRVVKFSTIGAIALAPANEAGALKARDADKNDPFKYIYSSGGGLKNLKARQVRIDPLGRVFDPGPRA